MRHYRLLPVFLFLVLAAPPAVPLAAGASISISETEGAIPFTATAIDSGGVSQGSSVTIPVDNTPQPTVGSPGQAEGAEGSFEAVTDDGMLDLAVTCNGVEISGAPVDLFTDTGTYLDVSRVTGSDGHAQFQVPVKAYRFRVEYNGTQYWTEVITPIAHQSLAVEVPLEKLALMPTNDPLCERMDWSIEPEVSAYVSQSPPQQGLQVASTGSLIGILSQGVIAQTPQTKVYYFITDHLGTPRKMMDEAGAVVWSADYKPFGEVSSGVSTVQNNLRFPGQYFDQETGLHYNYHRYYHPRVGRYMTPDPIGLSGGINLFGYADNSPKKIYDPKGLASLVTDRDAGTTTFDPRPEDPSGESFTIETRVNVASDSLPGAQGAFTTPDVIPRNDIRSPAYGPAGAYIDTGDTRGRDIHGGGTRLPDPYLPRQGWAPTRGCTRGQNEEVQELNRKIKDFQQRYPGVLIPYTRR